MLPDIAAAPHVLVDLMGAERFPRVQNFAEIKGGTRSQQRMNVVGHHHPRDKIIALAVKVFQGTGNDLRDRWLSENAVTMSGIQPLLDFFREQLVVFLPLLRQPGFRVGVQPFTTGLPQCDELFLRQGVVKAKGDEVGAALLPPVRQIAT